MEQFIQNILEGVRQWVNGKLEDLSFVISSHINSLTSRMTTAEAKLGTVQEGAQANVIEAITVNGASVQVTDKTAAIQIQEVTVGSNDKVLALSSDKTLSSTISLVYESSTHLIKLVGKNSEVISSFSANDFIKDGMLDSVGLYTRTSGTWSPALPTLPEGTTTPDTDGTYILLVWNTDANKTATFVNVSSLVNIYTAGAGLTLANNEFSLNAATTTAIGGVKVGSGLSVDSTGVLSVPAPTVEAVLTVLNANETVA